MTKHHTHHDNNPHMAEENADSGTEAAAGSETAQPPESEVETLTQQLAEMQKKAQESEDNWLRAKAETENVRRRLSEEMDKKVKAAGKAFATAMLPVKDSLEAALKTDNQTVDKLAEGVELTLKQLQNAFSSEGLMEVDPLNGKFDPNLHQAISAVPHAEVEPNTVIQVLQKGYLLHGLVIRPALVIVSSSAT